MAKALERKIKLGEPKIFRDLSTSDYTEIRLKSSSRKDIEYSILKTLLEEDGYIVLAKILPNNEVSLIVKKSEKEYYFKSKAWNTDFNFEVVDK